MEVCIGGSEQQLVVSGVNRIRMAALRLHLKEQGSSDRARCRSTHLQA